MSEKMCKNCANWTRSDESDSLIEIDEVGFCSGLEGAPYPVSVFEEGIEVEYPEFQTDYDFYCKNYQPKEEIKNART